MQLIDADAVSNLTPVSDLPPEVVERMTEMNSVTEKPITYDFSIRVKNPVLSIGEMLVLLHIDLEFQNRYRPVLKDGRSYPLIKRGIYYTAREIGAQLGRLTNETNYGALEKVISIWIVNEDIPKDIQNTATRYYIEKEDFIGATDEPKPDHDLIEVVIIRRSGNDGITEPLFEYLKSVYDADLDMIDKYTPVSANPELKKEVEEMPGMSQAIYDSGYDSGYGSGYGSGYDSGQVNIVMGLVDDGDITIERASEKLNKPTDEIQRLLEEYIASKKTQTEKKNDAN